MALKEDIILPEILEKLKIVSATENKALGLIGSSSEMNPFINSPNGLMNNNNFNDSSDENLIKIFGPKCKDCDRINIRDNIDNNHSSSQNLTNPIRKLENVIKNVSFKTKNTKKSILKKPIIKYFGSCTNHNHNHYKLIQNENNLNKIFGENINTVIDDDNFKSLASKYSSLSLDNYNTNISSSTTIDRLHSNSLIGNINNSRQSDNHYPQLGNNSNNNTATTSCSLQARINVRDITACDVTIDELASYFETFVHIPKKMSTMAEMMYI